MHTSAVRAGVHSRRGIQPRPDGAGRALTFKLRDLAAADHQDTRSALVVTEMVTKTENAG
jgi:hypothetical protein